jgi:polysaccharide biosynthesis transport protein
VYAGPGVSQIEPTAAPARPENAALAKIVALMRRRYRLVLVCGILAAIAAYALSLAQANEYAASASLLFRTDSGSIAASALGGADNNVSATSGEEAQEITATNAQLVSLSTIAQKTATALGLPLATVRDAVTVNPEGISDVVQITATTRTPKLSAQIANQYADQFVTFRANIDSAAYTTAENLAKTELGNLTPSEQAAEGHDLDEEVHQLALLASLQSGNAEVVQAATVPTGPSSPRPKRNAAIGLLLGLLLGVVLVIAADRLDRRLRDEEEIEAILGRPLLGSLPKSRVLAAPGIPEFSRGDLEAFQLVRANLRFFVNPGGRQSVSYLMTSAQPGDGKTTVSLFLGIAAAVAGDSVLLIEADLRKGGRMHADTGLSLVLAGAMDLESAVRPMHIPRAGFASDDDATGLATIDILPAGPRPPNPTDLMGSPAMRKLIERSERQYDLVIIDAPPLTIVSDAIPLTAVVAGVLVVVRPGRTDRRGFRRMTEMLANLHAPVTGVVINGDTEDRTGSYGYYGYSDPARLRPVV